MRILPAVYLNRSFVNSAKSMQNQNKTSNNTKSNHSHKYTGNACTDLAYASMFDSAIAKDLKLMGLI